MRIKSGKLFNRVYYLKRKSIAYMMNIRPLRWIEKGIYCAFEVTRFGVVVVKGPEQSLCASGFCEKRKRQKLI